MSAKISLDQWQALIAVVDEGGYANAAEALDKSQSAISYAVQKIETELGVRAFALEGRKAKLTETGQMLYRQAKILVDEAERIESTAIQLSQGWEPLVRVAADALFPQQCMLTALDAFAQQSPLTRIEYVETVLSGSDEALLRKEADVVVNARIPPGFVGEPLMRVRFLAVAAADHPLNQAESLTHEDLRQHRQIVIRDSGSRRIDAGWLGAEQRWTVSHSSTRIAAIRRGLGFAWVPDAEIGNSLDTGELKVLPLSEGVERFVDLHLIYADGQYAGQAARFLGEQIRQAAAKPCSGVTVS
ncbi:LysR family transcriptional regulator [Alcanivorax sp. S6407]|uniref:LysR family transcriptional regulator n=1 Tax=Alcanivorax sp. S6407 TaxID=2926424 RepID=UPI001FF4B8C3|nr:LysR family transcriptional regulator [Alcanivorax sp. S6407]MCK0154425.1 LysR family transcriptional regulator [Alcanivorax sp. S6407]